MNILVICQYYYPEPFRITDICEALVKNGHEVTVLTGVPNYPEGIIYDGYNNRNKRREVINGVQILRCFTIPRKSGAVYRLLNYCSYAISSSLKALCMRKKYDVVFVNQLSPVMMACAALVYKKIYHKNIVMYCLDLWPESLIAGGIHKESFIYNIFFYISKKLYQACDVILVTSKSFINQLSANFGINRNILKYAPQYAENLFEQPMEDKQKKSTIDLVFAGNLGEIQSVETILRAAAQLKKIKKLVFHIVGGGTDEIRLQKIAKTLELQNVVFHGRKPISQMPYYYSFADAMLVTLAADPVLSLTLPGKIQSYMAAGKVIIGAIDGEAQHVIFEAGCGFIGAAENEKKLVENIQAFLELSNEEKMKMENNSKKYYKEYFSKGKFINTLEQALYSQC